MPAWLSPALGVPVRARRKREREEADIDEALFGGLMRYGDAIVIQGPIPCREAKTLTRPARDPARCAKRLIRVSSESESQEA